MKKRDPKLSVLFLAFITILLYLPIILIILYSFNKSKISSVWKGFSLHWYQALFHDEAMFEALANSVVLAISASTAAAVIGTLAAVGFSKIKPRGKGLIEFLSTLPIMIPEIILGMVFMVFFSLIGLPFGMTTLILSHTAFCIPYSYMLVKARLVGMDKGLAEAAKDLGASESRVFFDITLPYLLPAILSGLLLGFAMSFDDVIISLFVTGVNVNTLPIKIYTQIKTGVTPEINALCTILLAVTIMLISVSALLHPSHTGKAGRKLLSFERTNKMKKSLLLLFAATALLLLLSGCKADQTKENKDNTNPIEDAELNLFTWEGMFPQEVLDDFTEETGIVINYSSFDTDETMLSKLQAAKGGDYDLIIADDYIIETAISAKLVQELDKSKLNNLKNINKIYQGQFFDPKDAYTVPYGAGVQTIVYNPDMIDLDITGYSDLWNEKLKDNLAIIGNYRVINGMALKVNGESYNTEDTKAIERAGEKLLELAPNIRLIKDDNVQDDLLSGEAAAAVMYTSQVTMACLENPDLKVVYPKEGIGFGIMAQFIPVKAPHPGAAYRFIDYILQPEIAKKCFEFIGYYSTNTAADELIESKFREFLTLPQDFSGNTEMIQNVNAQTEETHVKVWTEFKSACGQ